MFRRIIVTVLEFTLPHFKSFQVSNQTQSTEVTTESSEWQVVGLADLSALPPKILDFCGTLPIYEIEEKENPSDNKALGEDSAKETYDKI